VEGAGEVAGLVNRVGVGEEEPSAAGLLRGRPAGVGFAGEAAAAGEVERRGGEDDDAVAAGGGGLGDLAGAVDGVVVDDDQFPLGAEGESAARIGL
jgi:hypothetical protein